MFTKTKDGTSSNLTPAQEAVRGASSKPASKVGASIICSDMMITGSITANGAIQIDGRVEGDISANDLVIGSTGEIDGEIKAETLRVKGKVQGSVRAKKVELETGATVVGDIIHGALIIQPDASFEGQVKREDNPLSVQQPKPAISSDSDKEAATASATDGTKPVANGSSSTMAKPS